MGIGEPLTSSSFPIQPPVPSDSRHRKSSALGPEMGPPPLGPEITPVPPPSPPSSPVHSAYGAKNGDCGLTLSMTLFTAVAYALVVSCEKPSAGAKIAPNVL